MSTAAPATRTTTAAPTVIAPSAPSDGTSLRTAAILGGCVFVLFVAGLLFLLCRCQRRRRDGAVAVHPPASVSATADGTSTRARRSNDPRRRGDDRHRHVVSFAVHEDGDPTATAPIVLGYSDKSLQQLDGSDDDDYYTPRPDASQQQHPHAAGPSDQPLALDTNDDGGDGTIPTPRRSVSFTAAGPLAQPLVSRTREERGAALL